MMSVFIAVVCSLFPVCSVFAQINRQEGTDGQTAIYRLSPFEWALLCTKIFDGWHSEKHYLYVGYGYKLLPGEKSMSPIAVCWIYLLSWVLPSKEIASL